MELEFDATPVAEVKIKKPTEKKEKAPKVEKDRVNGLIEKSLVDKLKNIVLWHPEVTLTELLEEGIRYVVEKRGDLPMKEGKLKVGRRSKKVADSTTTSPSDNDVPKTVEGTPTITEETRAVEESSRELSTVSA